MEDKEKENENENEYIFVPKKNTKPPKINSIKKENLFDKNFIPEKAEDEASSKGGNG